MAAQDDGLYARTPWSPPIVEMTGGAIGHLLCWERHERDGTWYAWVSWVQSTGDPVRHRHHVVSVRADGLRRLENPEAYQERAAPHARPRRPYPAVDPIRISMRGGWAAPLPTGRPLTTKSRCTAGAI